MNALLLPPLADAQSVLAPAAEQASRISSLWWFYFAVLVGIYTLVLAALITGVVLRGRSGESVAGASESRERALSRAVWGATFATVVVLFVLLFADVFADREISSPAPEDALVITLTGQQWWWEVRYENSQPSLVMTTANELHIPADRPVRFNLRSRDVIHSFWVPNLHGKKDLIPGHDTSTWFIARKPGTYFGQCAEFCGYEHALMRLSITVEPAEKFEAWIAAQRQSAPEPQTASQRRGQQLFLGTTCAMCHTIQGTPARATVGPDLTHIGSRERLAAGALPNTPEQLARWIADPQSHKPGVRMPQHQVPREELDALVAYLTSLR